MTIDFTKPEAVSEREFKQFLSDVLTAAGLVTHGKKCKDLGRRLGEMSMRLLMAPKTAAAPSGPARESLTAAQMEAGREAIFSTGNPYCPCDSKTFRKVAEWVERRHGITAAPKGGEHAN